jgi:tetratricopeptide (TPR) repeat protein
LLPEYVGATPNELPVVLREWLDAWKEAELGGKSANVKQIESLGLLLLRDDVPSLCAVQTINLIAELDGWDAVKPIVAPVTGKAVASLSGLTVGNRTGRPLLNSLWAMEDNVWAAKDWPLAETLLAALLPFETAGSGHAQAAAYSHAESVYMLKRYDQALIEFNAIMNARATASEPSDGINRALDWELGLCLYYMARYAEALPHFQATTANTGTPEAKEAWPFAIVCLARTGNLVGANALLDRWIETCRPDVAAVTPILKAIKDPALAIGAPSPSANGM